MFISMLNKYRKGGRFVWNRFIKIAGISTLAAVIGMAGCSKTNNDPEPEQREIAVQVTQAPTPTPFIPTPTPTPEPTPTPVELTVKDLQLKTESGNRSGIIRYIIESDAENFSGQGSFQSSPDSLYAYLDSGEIYLDGKSSLYNNGDWHELDGDYDDVWEALYSDDCVRKENVTDNGAVYYHLQSTVDHHFDSMASICSIHEFTDLINGSSSYDIYIDKDTFEIKRMDIEIPFRGTKDGKSQKGTLYVNLVPNGTEGVTMERPQPVPEFEDDGYEPGTISVMGNSYLNKTFDLQITGSNVFAFSESMTESVAADYQQRKTVYTEEAYGEADGIVVNISSIRAGGNTKEGVLAKYLEDTQASDVEESEKLTIGATNYITAAATINGTKTKTFCGIAGDRVLLITVYYADESTLAKFSECLYSYKDNPNWEEESWILQDAYKITTPKGYSIVKEESGTLYVCMRSTSDNIDIFAVKNATIDSEIAKESAANGDETKEIITNEDIPFTESQNMRFVKIHAISTGNDYYVYLGLIQEEDAVIKLYGVSIDPDMDYEFIFQKFRGKITKETQEAATVAESETPTT